MSESERIGPQIKEFDEKINRECKEDKDIQRVQTIPGVGDKTALAFAAYVGDGKRFSNGDQAANCLGLVPRVDKSSTIIRYEHISKQGNRTLRYLLYQAAWAMVRSEQGGALKAKFLYLTEHGKGKKKSITAIARKTAKLLYVLIKNKQVVYKQMPYFILQVGYDKLIADTTTATFPVPVIRSGSLITCLNPTVRRGCFHGVYSPVIRVCPAGIQDT